MSPNQVANASVRRSSRIHKAITLAVQGVDSSRAPFREEVTTGTISCHGCAYQMKHEVLPGDIVVLSTGQGAKGDSELSRRARVKSIQELSGLNDPTYNVGVELEVAGNIWGIASPPEDWFPVQSGKLLERSDNGREFRPIARTGSQRALARTEAAVPVPILTKNEAAAALAPWFSTVMTALSNQIHVAVSQMAASTLANERNRLLEEFRAQIRNEAPGTIEQVITTSKDELARRGLKVLNEGAEAILTGTVERLERKVEASGTQATERFVSRLREQVAPVVQEAKEDLQKMVASQAVFKEESQAIYQRVTTQLESETNARLLETQDRLEKNSTTVVNGCNEKLLELSQTVEKTARDNTQSMIASSTDDAKKNLEERAAEISTAFTAQLGGNVRNFLETIVESIVKFPEKSPEDSPKKAPEAAPKASSD